MKKRGIIISDPHCGHLAGLTHPDWQVSTVGKTTTKQNKWATLQHEMWEQYRLLLAKHAPYDFGLSLGDSIDGNGKRSGGSELITTDREKQCDMAVACYDQVRLHARKGFQWVGVHGTPYHVGNDEDWESIMAERAGFKKIGSHEWVKVNGCVIDMKHHLGSSSIPHGRYTALAKDALWNGLWAERKLTPKADIILRGHVHYHAFCGGPGWLAMTCPALQGMGSKYGSRKCSGTVDWGITILDIDDDGSFSWHCDTVKIQTQRTKVVIL